MSNMADRLPTSEPTVPIVRIGDIVTLDVVRVPRWGSFDPTTEDPTTKSVVRIDAWSCCTGGARIDGPVDVLVGTSARCNLCGALTVFGGSVGDG